MRRHELLREVVVEVLEDVAACVDTALGGLRHCRPSLDARRGIKDDTIKDCEGRAAQVQPERTCFFLKDMPKGQRAIAWRMLELHGAVCSARALGPRRKQRGRGQGGKRRMDAEAEP